MAASGGHFEGQNWYHLGAVLVVLWIWTAKISMNQISRASLNPASSGEINCWASMLNCILKAYSMHDQLNTSGGRANDAACCVTLNLLYY